MRHKHPPVLGRSLKQVIGVWIAVLITSGVLSSCYTVKSSLYFRTLSKDTTLSNMVDSNMEIKIRKGDILNISVSSMSNEQDNKFNAIIQAQSSTAGIPGFQVDDKGIIQIHYIGNVPVEGKTRKQLKEELQKSLEPYFRDPIVSVQFANHKVTVMGEVQKPQVINLPEEQITLIDALVSSGDVKETADRKKIMIIREEQNQKKIKILNLENQSIFNSPWYYVQPNDIVYVMADQDRYVKEEKRRKVQSSIALIASTTSLVAVFLNFLLR